jgi:NmrA-like family
MAPYKEETSMNSSRDKVAMDAMYVVLGSSGNTGSIIADFLLSKGQKVRVVGRDLGRLQRFVRNGAEAYAADLSDAAALTKAFGGARAAYLLLPPLNSREEQERQSDASEWRIDFTGVGGRRCTLKWHAIRGWTASGVVYEHHYSHERIDGPRQD